MISQAQAYLGKPWISGAASSPAYGVDCSGLALIRNQLGIFNMLNPEMNGIVKDFTVVLIFIAFFIPKNYAVT